MRLKIFLPIIVIVALIAAVVIGLVFAGNSGVGPLAGFLGNDSSDTAVVTTNDDNTGDESGEPGLPPPTATPALRLVPVVVAKTTLPIGERITRDLVTIEQRPDTNIALQGGYTFEDIEDVIGTYTRVEIQEDQEVLAPMIALNPSELGAFGSDLSLYVSQGQVAIAFPINKYTGLAYTMRPGDLVDVMMTFSFVDIDPEFSTALPNVAARVHESSLLMGQQFLLPEEKQGRLDFISEINKAVEFVPSDAYKPNGYPIPQRVTQLTIQQAGVVWVGTWQEPRARAVEEEVAVPGPGGLTAADDGVEIVTEEEGDAANGNGSGQESAPTGPTPTPWPVRYEETPDVVILSMSAQDALVLKWALERGVEINLALRAQGDRTVFTTDSVELPKIINSGILFLPDERTFDLDPHPEDVPSPYLPPVSVTVGQDDTGGQ